MVGRRPCRGSDLPAASKNALPSYEQLDANNDGIVTLPEVEVHNPELAHRIAHCDTNGDNKLSREEYGKCHLAPEKKNHA